MLRVDKGRCAAALLGLCNGLERERCLARAFGAIDFDNSATGQAANTKRDVEAQRAGGNCLDLHLVAASQLHGGAFAKSAINLRQRGRSEEHQSELQSIMRLAYAVFCLKKKSNPDKRKNTKQTQHKHKHL